MSRPLGRVHSAITVPTGSGRAAISRKPFGHAVDPRRRLSVSRSRKAAEIPFASQPRCLGVGGEDRRRLGVDRIGGGHAAPGSWRRSRRRPARWRLRARRRPMATHRSLRSSLASSAFIRPWPPAPSGRTRLSRWTSSARAPRPSSSVDRLEFLPLTSSASSRSRPTSPRAISRPSGSRIGDRVATHELAVDAG